MVALTVQEFLRRGNAAYTVFRHAPAFTAQEEAAAAHVPGRNWAKAVVCFADGDPIQAVVPADREVDLERLADLVRAHEVRLADEIVFNAGTHSDAICMRYRDFAAIAKPLVGRFAERVLV